MAKERKGKKLRRCAKLAPYYKAQPMRTATNKKRRMQKHIRSHPADVRAKSLYETQQNFGRADTLGLTSKGKKRQRRREQPRAEAA